MLSVFLSYSHEDEHLRSQLEQQLTILKRQKIIDIWHDRRIVAGDDVDHTISANLEAANIILLLVSPSFLASNYCYDREMQRALQRQSAGESVVIAVILRPCEWQETGLGKLMATPTDGKPITQWPDRDEAFLDVARAIRAAANRLKMASHLELAADTVSLESREAGWSKISHPHSSNLQLSKHFTEREKDRFKVETFEFMARFFEGSLQALQVQNPGVESVFRRIDANRFSAVIYRGGQAIARCTVFMDGAQFVSGIAYSASETVNSNAFNENLSVEDDGQQIYLKALGMSFQSNASEQLSQKGAAELYWAMLIDPFRRP